jgi:glycosyltransferase involved in cell wall biosynthesis
MQRFRADAKFIIVGDGPFRTTLQEEHRDLIFCGVHTGEDLAKHYASADVFLFPSETETFGNVTLEAMASGLVVVAYDYAAARMHVTNGGTGVLVPCGVSQAFVDAAANLAHAPQSLPNIRWQARAYARSIAWPHVVEKFETLLTGGPVRGHATPSILRASRGVSV